MASTTTELTAIWAEISAATSEALTIALPTGRENGSVLLCKAATAPDARADNAAGDDGIIELSAGRNFISFANGTGEEKIFARAGIGSVRIKVVVIV